MGDTGLIFCEILLAMCGGLAGKLYLCGASRLRGGLIFSNEEDYDYEQQHFASLGGVA